MSPLRSNDETEIERLRRALAAVRELHRGWHVCVSGLGNGAATDYCDDEPGMGRCPTLAAVEQPEPAGRQAFVEGMAGLPSGRRAEIFSATTESGDQ